MTGDQAKQSLELVNKVNFIASKIRKSKQGFLASNAPSVGGVNEKRLIIARVDFPEEGGVLSFYLGRTYPMRGFAIVDTVQKLNIFKKFINKTIDNFAQHKISAFILGVFFRKQTSLAFWSMVESFSNSMQSEILEDNRWCKCVQEVRRVLDLMKVREELKDVISLLLEFDDEYRYRFQWLIERYQKKELVRELKRLLLELSNAETPQDKLKRMKFKWLKFRKFTYLLWLYPSLYKQLNQFLKKINIEEVKLTIEDKYQIQEKNNGTFNWGIEKIETLPFDGEILQKENPTKEDEEKITSQLKVIRDFWDKHYKVKGQTV